MQYLVHFFSLWTFLKNEIWTFCVVTSREVIIIKMSYRDHYDRDKSGNGVVSGRGPPSDGEILQNTPLDEWRRKFHKMKSGFYNRLRTTPQVNIVHFSMYFNV